MIPSWTLFACVPGDKYVGTCWQFFDDEEIARLAFDEATARGWVCTLRPFAEADRRHMGAAHG